MDLYPRSRVPAFAVRFILSGALAGLAAFTSACSGEPELTAAAAAVPETGANPAAAATAEALGSLKLADADRSVLSVRVKSLPPNSVFASAGDTPQAIPLQARRQLLIQLRPGLAAADIQSLLDTHGVEPVKVLPEIGLVVAQLRGTPGLQAAAAVSNAEELDELELFAVIDRLSADQRVQAAAPNSVLSTLQLRSVVQGSGTFGAGAAAAAGETQDWGIADARIAGVWPKLTATSTVGVIDVGFAAHNDLDMRKGLEVSVASHNHGNHVAGILCAKHNDIGVRGVLPNCTVVYATAEALLRDSGQVEGGDEFAWFAFFSDYIASVLSFINRNPDIKVINLSLGYNWLPNFRKDPRLEARIKNVIRSQGRIYMTMLETAAEKDIAIVSAAGNDSDGLDNPLEAKWASPFNFGSSLMLGTRGWTNGLVVEAHDRQGRRAAFSNVGGDITCPGVDILSTTATSATSTALMSGTSMASPYCAGALAALRAVKPEVSLRNAMRCLRRSPRNIGGVPALDLEYAIEHCTDNPAALAHEEREDAIRRWTSVLSEDGAGAALAAVDTCSYRMRREFTVTAVADLGDGQGPEFSDPNTRAEITSYVNQLLASGCRQPAMITLRFGFDAAYRQRLDFALATLNAFSQARYPGGAMLVEVPQFAQSNELRQFTDRVVVLVGDANLAANLSGRT